MRGEFIGVWSETWREIWLPLIEQPFGEDGESLPEDIFCELYRDLSMALKKPTDAAAVSLLLGNAISLREVFEGAAEPDRVASWDEVPGEAGMHPAELRQKPVESHEAIRHLIELGYLEPPDADVEQAIEVCLATNQYNLGRALLNAGLANEAIAILKPLVERHPETSEFSKALGKAQRAVCNTKLVHPPSPSPSPGPGEGF